MTSMTRRNFVATLGAAGALALAGCNGSEQPAETTDETTEEASYTLVKEGVLTNVAELGFSPFEYIDDEGTTVGFDVDLSNAIAEKMGLTCEWLPNQALTRSSPPSSRAARPTSASLA